MSHIFISYSRDDSDFVNGLIADIEKRGIEVWIDRQDISGGETWRAAIAEAIRSCDAFVIVLSPNSTVSKNVSRELSIAEPHHRPIIPLLYQPCEIPPNMEYQLAEIQWIDFTAEKYADALERLIKVLGKPASATSRPATTPIKREGARTLLWAGTAVAIVLLVLGGFALNRLRSDGATEPTPTPAPSPTSDGTTVTAEKHLLAVRLTVQGIDKYNDGNIDGARLLYSEAIQNDPGYDEAYFYRAQAFVALKKPERAIEDFEKVLQLSSNPDLRKDTEEFLRGLKPDVTVAGQTSPTPPTSASPSASIETPRVRPVKSRAETDALVREMFVNDKSRRIKGATRLIIEQKNNPYAVTQAINEAMKQLDNKSGVINTLVYLESVPVETLKSHQAEVENFLKAVRKTNPGEQTVGHLKEVERRLGG
jgi:tetratricopeptide (TPR) repeat protein